MCVVFFLLVARENFINITFFWHFLCVFLKGFKRAADDGAAAVAAARAEEQLARAGRELL